MLADAKRDLELEHMHLARGARIRARARWAEEGEVSTSYFLSCEKYRAVRKRFHGIRDVRGVVFRSTSAMIRVWCLFYYTLFPLRHWCLRIRIIFLIPYVVPCPIMIAISAKV